MRIANDQIRLAPTDLSGFLNCRHLTSLDLRAAQGEFERPKIYSPVTEALQEKGREHEQSYLAHLKTQHDQVIELGDHASLDETLAAMHAGADVIFQARLANGNWGGYADFLIKVGTPSDLGDYAYEVQDTKLARNTKAGTVLQLCVYSFLLEKLQGVRPTFIHVVAPGKQWQPSSYRIDDYSAYFRLLEQGIERFVQAPEKTYPELVAHCDFCAYWQRCEKRRREDDQLCYVAGIGAGHIEHLRVSGIQSLAAFAAAEHVAKPQRGSEDTLLRLQDQARIQWLGRQKQAHLHELKYPIDREHGFQRLPAPTPDDLYLDFEGSHFGEDGVQEYLTGWVTFANDHYHYTGLWADTLAQEKVAFETFMDVATALHTRNPLAHIYHFAPYETVALKRLMGRFATREAELDVLLHHEVFVDLHGIVKRSLIASVESYSIKNLEAFFGYERQQNLREASASRRVIETALEFGSLDDTVANDRRIVEDYNREDCESTHRLQIWLEQLRTSEEHSSGAIPRTGFEAKEPKELNDLDIQLQVLRDTLIKDISADETERSDDEQARFLLGHMMEFHRREEKAAWWEYFRLRDLVPEEMTAERRAMTGLSSSQVVEPRAAPVVRYHFAEQDADARDGDEVYDTDGNKIGTVNAVDFGARTIDIKHQKASAAERPHTVYFHKFIGAGVIRESLMRLGRYVIGQGLAPREPYQTALRLLTRSPPGDPAQPLRQGDESMLQTATRLALDLHDEVLAIQGPPGAGKTFTGGEIICSLVAAGKSVGITAVSHRVIHNLMETAAQAAENHSIDLHLAHYPGGSGHYTGNAAIANIKSYDKVHDGLKDGSIRVLGGTQWMWARETFEQSVDVLIVDEAGQMALSNVLATAPAARSLILLGDPQQLEQPIQSSHPEGSDIAALKHWLGGHETMPTNYGLFLDETWRLHPDLCHFTAEIYYENKLKSRPDLVHQAILPDPKDDASLAGSGLRYCRVEHSGNTAKAPEEVALIAQIVAQLTAGAVNWVDKFQDTHPITVDDILIVAPYNAQVAALKEKLPLLINRIGTVDKFQGQEAAIVIYSMTSSSPQDAPRGMEFLYNPNRFNVATSRARALCILVGSPRLLEPLCKTPQQMKMANGFCRFGELATSISLTMNK